MEVKHTDIFQRLLKGEAVPFNDPDYSSNDVGFRIVRNAD